MWTEKIIQFSNSLFSRGVVLIDPSTGDPYAASTGSADRELVVSTYLCKTAFTGASVGDTITATQIIDVSGETPTTVSTIWRNQNTSADLASTPSVENLELTGSTALTAAQLAAAGLALDSSVQATNTSLGTDGSAPPSIAGTGVRGWLRAIYESLVAGIGVTGPLTSAQLATAALATDAVAQGIRDRLPASFATPGLLAVDTLGKPGDYKVQPTTSAAIIITLTPTCRRASIYATQGVWWNYYVSGDTPKNAVAGSSHYIAAGERIDCAFPANTIISVLRETIDGSIRITEFV